MSSYTNEANEFSGYLEAAKEYDGFEEDSDEGTGEDQDAEDAGEGSEGTDEDQGDQATEGTEDEASFEVTLPGGQKATVPLSELVAGYSRTQDYTRKTQALAAERRNLADAAAIAQALERNPAAAIAALARAYGVAEPGDAQDQGYVSEDEQWRQQVDARFQAQDRMQREAALNNEIARLHGAYGDFDEEALFTQAVQTNTMNLEVVLRAMRFEEAQQAQATRTQRTNGKRAAAAAPPASRNGRTSQPVVDDGEISNFRDAYKYAKRVLES